jgi:hypothetical protein
MNNKFQARMDRKNNSIENYNLNRGIDVYTKDDKKLEVLNDREMFNHFSNNYEQIDMTNIKPNENTHGMPLFNPQILNNKKNLINNPYIQESNEKNNFRALKSTSNISNKYASLELDDNQSNNSEYGKFNEYENININKNDNIMENAINKSEDNIEKGIIIYEHSVNMEKEKSFMMDINSPFALAYLWKSLILLSKNPSTDKFLKLLQIKKKDEAVNDMKFYSDVFNDMGQIEYLIPYSSGIINTNFTKKIEELYKIKVSSIEKTNNVDNINSDNALITLNFKFEIKIPFYYQPEVISEYLLDYNINKIKFIKMLNVPCALDIDRQLDTVNIEFPIGDKMILGFMYNLSRKNIVNSELLYTKINQKREINNLIKEFFIPKINRTKKINYGKKFSNELKQIHLGEIIYGNMYDIDIFTNMNLEITVNEIKINHR